MSKKSTYKRLTEKEFDAIKAMQSAGVSSSVAARATGRSYTTIWYIYNNDTFSAYHEVISNRAARHEDRTKNQATIPDGFDVVPGVSEDGDDAGKGSHQLADSAVVAQLTRIADSMERLADAWENQPKRKLF